MPTCPNITGFLRTVRRMRRGASYVFEIGFQTGFVPNRTEITCLTYENAVPEIEFFGRPIGYRNSSLFISFFIIPIRLFGKRAVSHSARVRERASEGMNETYF